MCGTIQFIAVNYFLNILNVYVLNMTANGFYDNQYHSITRLMLLIT